MYLLPPNNRLKRVRIWSDFLSNTIRPLAVVRQEQDRGHDWKNKHQQTNKISYYITLSHTIEQKLRGTEIKFKKPNKKTTTTKNKTKNKKRGEKQKTNKQKQKTNNNKNKTKTTTTKSNKQNNNNNNNRVLTLHKDNVEFSNLPPGAWESYTKGHSRPSSSLTMVNFALHPQFSAEMGVAMKHCASYVRLSHTHCWCSYCPSLKKHVHSQEVNCALD